MRYFTWKLPYSEHSVPDVCRAVQSEYRLRRIWEECELPFPFIVYLAWGFREVTKDDPLYPPENHQET